MDTLTVQPSMILSRSCESIVSSLEQCPAESSTVLVKAQPGIKDGNQKKLQKPILIQSRNLSPVFPDTEVSRKRSVRTPTAALRANTAEKIDNALRLGVGDFAGPISRIATPNAGKKRKSLPRESSASSFSKQSKKLPPVKVPIQPYLMKFGSDEFTAILPQLKPSLQQPALPNNARRPDKVNIVVTNEREEAVPIEDPPVCSMEVDKGALHANSESLLPADSITNLLFEEISDTSDLIGMEDSLTKDSSIEEGAEEEGGGVKGEMLQQQAEHTITDEKQDTSLEVPSNEGGVPSNEGGVPSNKGGVGSNCYPPDQEFIQKAAKIRGRAQPLYACYLSALNVQVRPLLPS